MPNLKDYIFLFDRKEEYDDKRKNGYYEPWLSYTGDEVSGFVSFNKTVYEKPLTFKILSAGTISWKASSAEIAKTIEYSLDFGETWSAITSNTGDSAPSISVESGDTVWFRGDNAAYATSINAYNTFSGSTVKFDVEGNIMSLINSTGFTDSTLTLTENYVFTKLFSGCKNLLSAKRLVLPATTLTDSCYREMFEHCMGLTRIPALPATTLAINCYASMFYGCTSLNTTPALPATTLARYCYADMFGYCTSLTTTPELPATVMAYGCYQQMFLGCSSLTAAPKLPGEKLEQHCYNSMFQNCTSLTAAPVLPASALTASCYYGMFQGCTSLTSAPALPATTLAESCYGYMFYGCTNLTTAPALPATVMARHCYNGMFWNCSGLTVAPALPATTLAGNCYESMFYGCTSLTAAPELPATTLALACYMGMFIGCTSLISAPVLPATTLANGCYNEMFWGCTSLTTAPSILPATTLADSCYNNMFRNCTSLTTAPVLPATTLESNCYTHMFQGCTSLNYIKCLATNTGATLCTSNWVNGVAATGTFVKDKDMSSWTTGVDGIPVNWEVENDGEDYLTFEIVSAGSINWCATDASMAKSIEYKKNDGAWATITSNTGASAPSISVVAGDTLQFRGNNTAYADSNEHTSFSGSTAKFEVKGNIMSLINSTDFETIATLAADYTFYAFFEYCTGLTSAGNLILPATTLANSCYIRMFYGCTSLVTAPALPAATLTESCYSYMFADCTSLTKAPVLPATTLANGCYYGIFSRCTSLTSAPALPATILAERCYGSMFYGCTTLTTPPELPATTLAPSCYSSMFWDCSSLTTAPALPATTLVPSCYSEMFYGCTSLTAAPALPATTLVDGCYYFMFYGCTNLNYIKCLATDIPTSNCIYNWVNGVADTGTFVKNKDMSSWTTGANGIPEGWEVENDGEVKDYLAFKIISAGTIVWKAQNATYTRAIEYKKNDEEWTTITSNTGNSAPNISVSAGDTVRFRGNNATYATNPTSYNSFSGSTAKFEIEGNVMSLIDSAGFTGITSLSTPSAFYGIFSNCPGLTSAGNLILPATTLSVRCYGFMFSGCTGLTTPPALPANILDVGCYSGMFAGCTSLTTAPRLPATSLETSCYAGMFEGCTSLNNAPSLPATTLANACYQTMFQGCTSLTSAPILSAETLVSSCYSNMFNGCSNLHHITCLATGITATNCTSNWVKDVHISGSFEKDPNTTWSIGDDGIPTTWSISFNSKRECLTFNILSAGTLYWTGTQTLNYRKNNGNWATFGSSLSVTSGDVVRFKGDNTAYNGGRFSASTVTRFEAEGNIMSLINSTNFSGNTTLNANSTFKGLFNGCSALTSTKNLLLPATSLTIECYEDMFNGCVNLVDASMATVGLPATTLAPNCYNYMFAHCRSLTAAPKIKAVTLAENCFMDMFIDCTSLKEAPTLSAVTVMTYHCCANMFDGCTSLTTAPALPATTLSAECYFQMFKDCTSLTSAPVLPATTLAEGCYSYMFNGCTNLRGIRLPATTLVASCYKLMFKDCTSLNNVVCLATNINATDCTSQWLENVASSGTFATPSSTNWSTGTSGIPSGWNRVGV